LKYVLRENGQTCLGHQLLAGEVRCEHFLKTRGYGFQLCLGARGCWGHEAKRFDAPAGRGVPKGLMQTMARSMNWAAEVDVRGPLCRKYRKGEKYRSRGGDMFIEHLETESIREATL